MPGEEQIMKMKGNSKKWWILKVDLGYPEELHEEHNSYPLAPEKKQEVGTDAGGHKQLRGPPQKPAVLSQTKGAFVKRREIPSTRKVSSMVMQFMAGTLSKKKDNEFMEKLLEVLQSEESGGDDLPIGVVSC